MNELTRFLQLVSGLFAAGAALLLVSAIVGATGVVLITALVFISLGLAIYGVSAYMSGMVGMLRNTLAKSRLEKAGLIITIIGVAILWTA